MTRSHSPEVELLVNIFVDDFYLYMGYFLKSKQSVLICSSSCLL